MLEDGWSGSTGKVLLVSHDREFLNNVVTSTIAFEGRDVREYAGGYDDWLRQRPSVPAPGDTAGGELSSRSIPAVKNSGKARAPSEDESAAPRERRLTYKEKLKLAALPETISRLEAEIAELHEAMSASEFYKRPGEELARESARLRELDEQLVEAYHRWESLEARSA